MKEHFITPSDSDYGVMVKFKKEDVEEMFEKMKRIILVIHLLWLFTAFTPAAEENKPRDDPQKDLYFVEKTEPVPEKMKPGFDSITAAAISFPLPGAKAKQLNGSKKVNHCPCFPNIFVIGFLHL